jgi:hypothetical protein
MTEGEITVDIEYDDRFERYLKDGDVHADTGVRIRVCDTYLTGGPDRYSVSEFVVLGLQRLCDAAIDAMNGDKASVRFLASPFRLTITPVGDDSVLLRASTTEREAKVELRSFVEEVVRAASDVLSHVESADPALSDHDNVVELRTAVERAEQARQTRFGDTE